MSPGFDKVEQEATNKYEIGPRDLDNDDLIEKLMWIPISDLARVGHRIKIDSMEDEENLEFLQSSAHSDSGTNSNPVICVRHALSCNNYINKVIDALYSISKECEKILEHRREQSNGCGTSDPLGNSIGADLKKMMMNFSPYFQELVRSELKALKKKESNRCGSLLSNNEDMTKSLPHYLRIIVKSWEAKQRRSFGLLDCPLHTIGILQARTVGQKYVISMRDFTTVLVSPMRRTLMTCSLLFENHPDKDRIRFLVVPFIRESVAEDPDDIAGDFEFSRKLFTIPVDCEKGFSEGMSHSCFAIPPFKPSLRFDWSYMDDYIQRCDGKHGINNNKTTNGTTNTGRHNSTGWQVHTLSENEVISNDTHYSEIPLREEGKFILEDILRRYAAKSGEQNPTEQGFPASEAYFNNGRIVPLESIAEVTDGRNCSVEAFRVRQKQLSESGKNQIIEKDEIIEPYAACIGRSRYTKQLIQNLMQQEQGRIGLVAHFCFLEVLFGKEIIGTDDILDEAGQEIDSFANVQLKPLSLTKINDLEWKDMSR